MVDWQSESDLDSIRNSCDVCYKISPHDLPCWSPWAGVKRGCQFWLKTKVKVKFDHEALLIFTETHITKMTDQSHNFAKKNGTWKHWNWANFKEMNNCKCTSPNQLFLQESRTLRSTLLTLVPHFLIPHLDVRLHLHLQKHRNRPPQHLIFILIFLSIKEWFMVSSPSKTHNTWFWFKSVLTFSLFFF